MKNDLGGNNSNLKIRSTVMKLSKLAKILCILDFCTKGTANQDLCSIDSPSVIAQKYWAVSIQQDSLECAVGGQPQVKQFHNNMQKELEVIRQ